MELHAHPLSPFVRLVRVALIELGLDGAVRLIETPVSPLERNADYARIMPLRQLPALRLDDGTLLHDSTIILLWLDERSGGMLLPSGADKWPALARYRLAHGILEAALSIRYERLMRPEELRWQAWIDDKLDKIGSALDVLEKGQNDVGVVLDLEQIGLACALGYLDFRVPDLSWRERFPRLAVWYAEVAQRHSLEATVPVQASQ